MGYILDMVDKLVFSGHASVCRLEQSPRPTKSEKIPSKPVGEGLGPPAKSTQNIRLAQIRCFSAGRCLPGGASPYHIL